MTRTMGLLEIKDLAGRNLSELSSGQQQLVSIAQALVREPRILLLDETTSALDLQRQVEILELLRGPARGRGICVVVALHDLNHAMRFADRVAMIGGGQVEACGAPGAVLTPGLLHEAYSVQTREEHCSRGQAFIAIDSSVRKQRRPAT